MAEISLNDVKYTEQAAELLDKNSDLLKPDKKFGKRHFQVVNICFLVFVAYYSRNSLSVAIVAMNDRNSTINPNIPTYDWHNKNVIQSAFFVGYVPSQIIVSWLISKFGTKWLAVSFFCCCSISGIATPTVVYWFEDMGIMVMRLIQGLCQGFVFPSVQHVLSQWVPPNERAGLAGAVYAARPIATVSSMFITGYIAGSWYGWPWIFYISNGIGLLWCLSYVLFSYDNPASHPSMSAKERRYIDKSLGQENVDKDCKIPWKEIATSVPFWALVVTQTGFSWGFWTQQTQMPMYMKYVMKFDIESSGTLSALPYLVQWLLSYFFGFLSDYLLNRKIWCIDTARKTMNSIGLFIPAIIFILLQNSGPDESTKAVVLLVLGIAINGACFCGFMVNQMDLSPTFASILVGISNGPAQITGFLAPLFVQAIVKNETDPEEWKYVFYTAAGIYIVSGLIFIVFGSGNVQTWDGAKKTTDKRFN
ncbi:unnamed protein product [Psylliodes chrysocephalus]|uniref:Major facilitator superfamily (MFS) profile domain-containing protein n=1 Tax=Psylliodes chrysocephalus TaxID=3402493 RepID=A0A9P0CNB6_9CUCU|nr:unnamed protein product [Psylliodes chrysocephala]